MQEHSFPGQVQQDVPHHPRCIWHTGASHNWPAEGSYKVLRVWLGKILGIHKLEKELRMSRAAPSACVPCGFALHRAPLMTAPFCRTDWFWVSGCQKKSYG